MATSKPEDRQSLLAAADDSHADAADPEADVYAFMTMGCASHMFHVLDSSAHGLFLRP